MKILDKLPPNYAKIRSNLRLKKGLVFTYGSVIYNPDHKEIQPHLIKHEEVHCKQQGNDIEGWWDKYLTNAEFRLEQEIEAYAVQYKSIKDLPHLKDRDKKAFLDAIAGDLSGEFYGNIIDFHQASSRIRNYGRKD